MEDEIESHISSDDNLINEILSGNKISEIILYNKYREIIINFIYKKYGNINDINELTSEILTKIFINLKNFDSGKSKFNTWVINIAKNHLIDSWRSNKTINNLDSFYSTDISYSNNNFEYSDMVNYISTTLSKTDFDMLNMKYIEGYNYDEIGNIFNTTSSTVSNRINYIKIKLRKEFENKKS